MPFRAPDNQSSQVKRRLRPASRATKMVGIATTPWPRPARNAIECRTHRDAQGYIPNRRDHNEETPQVRSIANDVFTLWREGIDPQENNLRLEGERTFYGQDSVARQLQTPPLVACLEGGKALIFFWMRKRNYSASATFCAGQKAGSGRSPDPTIFPAARTRRWRCGRRRFSLRAQPV
jgi:hypothetical protein